MNWKRSGFLAALVLAAVAAFVMITDTSDAQRRRARETLEGAPAKAEVAEFALKTYVPPGDMDEYYAFLSGGHSGQVYVYGLPSMRHIRTIPVFSPYAATGWGWDKHSKEMMGKFTWGDVHHPGLSETKGEYDGRWLFVNDNANSRVARIDLKDFKCKQILGPIPNMAGNHASIYLTWNTEYLFAATRFAIPIPKGTVADVKDYATKYKGTISAIAVDPKDGTMSLGWQILMPPWDYDVADAGKLVSGDWWFVTTYNTEAEFIDGQPLEVTASQRDKDYIIAVHWKGIEAEVKKGNFTEIDGAKVFDPVKTPGYVFAIPCKKSPHGVDVSPDGKWIIGNGKLAPVVSIFSFEKLMKAIQDKNFAGKDMEIPVVKSEAVQEAEIPVGLGPLHTVFDDKGFAYTSLFVESAIAKWQWGGGGREWKMVDKIPIQYNIGHIASCEGDTVSPKGQWVFALNKLSKGTHLPVGPDMPESGQLIDISGPKMKLVYQAFPEPEPHYAQIIKADKIKGVIEVYTKQDNKDPNAIWDPKDTKVVREGDTVKVWMTQIRSSLMPNVVRCNQGDKVIMYITNIEEMRDELHGFAICGYDINGVPSPGETMTFEFVADKPGVWPYYCTNFCSALHQEMQGYLIVNPKGK
ncbi:MAG: Sec-dependent nitrous-oxide reductase [Thermodesulfobacteriota bacterium]